MTVAANGRTADHDIDPMFLERWSPRAFTGEAIPDGTLMTMFEAARWAPSAFNNQPWRFVYGKRDTPAWDTLFGLLTLSNQGWAANASALVVMFSDRLRRAPGRDPIPIHSHSFDAGAAWAHLALQAQRLGWAAHGMSGFDHPRAYEVLGAPEDQFRVEAAIAIGRPASADTLPEPYRSREVPSGRHPLARSVFEGVFRLDEG